MSQEGIKQTRNRRMIALAVFLAAFAAIVFTLWVYDVVSKINTQPDAPKPVVAAQLVETAPTPEPAASEAQPATEPETAEPTAQPVQTARIAVQEAPEPTSRWSASMTEAGISAADQPVVESIVFKDYEWSLHNCACSRLMQAASGNPTSRFQILNSYVLSHYANWTSAAAQAAQGAW